MSVKYRLTYDRFHVGALTQIGGYAQRNTAESAYQFDLGGDFGGLSVDAVYSYAKDAVALSNYTSGAPTPDTLKATLADINAGVIAAKYRWRALTVYGGLHGLAPEFAERPIRSNGDGERWNPHLKRGLPGRHSSQRLCES